MCAGRGIVVTSRATDGLLGWLPGRRGFAWDGMMAAVGSSIASVVYGISACGGWLKYVIGPREAGFGYQRLGGPAWVSKRSRVGPTGVGLVLF